MRTIYYYTFAVDKSTSLNVALGIHETRVKREMKFFGTHRPEVGQVSDWLTEKFFSSSHEGTDAGL